MRRLPRTTAFTRILLAGRFLPRLKGAPIVCSSALVFAWTSEAHAVDPPTPGERAPVPSESEAPPTTEPAPSESDAPTGSQVDDMAGPASVPPAETDDSSEEANDAGDAPDEPAPREQKSPSSEPWEEEEGEEEAEIVKPALDTLGGHFVLGLLGGGELPFGSFESDRSQSSALSPGWTAGVDVGYGVSRTVVLALSGAFSAFPSNSDCSGCDGRSFSIGPRVRYHLVQGLRFDPWLSAGLAFRQTTISNDVSYRGLDWFSLQIGGDWYATSNFGFGPVLDLSLGTFFDKSEGNFDGSVYGHLKGCLRLVFDLPGK